jgi:hypothetical protein
MSFEYLNRTMAVEIAKLGEDTVPVEVAKLHPDAMLFLLDYGLKQKLSDCVSSLSVADLEGKALVTKRAEIRTKIEVMRERLYEGTFATKASGDDVTRIAHDLIEDALEKSDKFKAAAKAAKLKSGDKGYGPMLTKARKDWLNDEANRDKAAAFFKTARARVEENKGLEV